MPGGTGLGQAVTWTFTLFTAKLSGMATYRYSKEPAGSGAKWLPVDREAAASNGNRQKPVRMSEKIAQWKDELKAETDDQKKARQYPPSSTEVKYGPRGGRYTEVVTRYGRQYRRYF